MGITLGRDDAGDVDIGDGDRVRRRGGETGVGEKLIAGETGDGGVVRFGELAKALDAHLGVCLREESGLFNKELGAETAVGFELFKERELV